MLLLPSISLLCFASTTFAYFDHSTSSALFIHSNDTIQLSLKGSDAAYELHGPPGSSHNLKYTVVNRHSPAQFKFSFKSNDGLVGFMNPRQKFLAQGQQEVIELQKLVVPNQQVGEKLEFTVTAARNSPFSKRSVPLLDDGDDDGGDIHHEGHLMNDEAGDGRDWMSSGGPGVGGHGDYPMDPSQKSRLPLTAIFTVTDQPLYDSTDPAVRVERVLECQSQSSEVCGLTRWEVRFIVNDENSGLNLVEVLPKGEGPSRGDPIYYRYPNFAVGSKEDIDVLVSASCCLEEMELIVSDVAGNVKALQVENQRNDDYYDYDGAGSLTAITTTAMVAITILTRAFQ